MNIINQSSLPPAVNTFFNKAILAFEQPDLIYGMFSQKDVKPTKTGDYYRYEKIAKLKTATVPLGNTGINPKHCGVIKSLLIDLESEVAFS